MEVVPHHYKAKPSSKTIESYPYASVVCDPPRRLNSLHGRASNEWTISFLGVLSRFLLARISPPAIAESYPRIAES